MVRRWDIFVYVVVSFVKIQEYFFEKLKFSFFKIKTLFSKKIKVNFQEIENKLIFKL